MTHPLHLNPPLNLAIPPNLSLTLFVSHLNNSKSVLNKIWTQYVHSTYFWCNYIAVKTKTFQCKSNCLDITYNIQQCCECVQSDSQKFYSQLQSCQLELLGYWKQCRKCCWDLWCVMLCSPTSHFGEGTILTLTSHLFLQDPQLEICCVTSPNWHSLANVFIRLLKGCGCELPSPHFGFCSQYEYYSWIWK